MMVILSGTRRMRYAAILAKIIVVALVFALMWIAMPVGVAAGETYNGVDFPLGDKSFADEVEGFNPGKDTVSPHNNPQTAIGPPDYTYDKAYVALGHGGNLTVRFRDNYLIDVEGPDLYVFEIGGRVEPFKVEISKDGSNWIDLGTVSGQPRSLDIHNNVATGDKFSYVRITDAKSHMSGHPYAGADIDAVGAIGAEEREKIILKLSKDGYASVKQEIENAENFGSIEISGSVTDKSTGEPIEGAKVEIVKGADPASTTTDADGSYTITVIIPDGSGSDAREDVYFELTPSEYIVGVYEIASEVFDLIEENNGTIIDQCQYADGPRALLVYISKEEE